VNINKKQTSSPNFWQRILWWASGATPYILQETPSEHKKYAAIGASMLFISIVAATGAGFALEQSFDNLPVAIIGGLSWGALILTVDRLIQISLRKEENKGRKALWMALPRLLMIIVLSFLITDPLLHKFFEREIDYQLSRETQQATTEATAIAESRNNNEKVQLDSEIQRLTEELKRKEAERDKKYNEWMAEGAGTGGTLRQGKGPFYREKEDAFRKSDREYQELKISVEADLKQFKDRLQELKRLQVEETARLTGDKAKARGLLARNSALFTIMRHDFGAAVFAILLMLAFILLESTPLTIKLMTSRGPYEERFETEEQEQIFTEKQRLVERQRIIVADSNARIESSARLHSLQKAARDTIATAVLSGKAQDLNPKLAEVVDLYTEHVRAELIKLLQKKQSSAAAAGDGPSSSGALTEKPTPIEVRLLEPVEDHFTINFNLPENLVQGRDLLYALNGIDERLLPQNDGRPALSAYRAVNQAGVEIEPDKSLLAQLNGTKVVNLVLISPSVSDAYN
jgi:hypothetical protein